MTSTSTPILEEGPISKLDQEASENKTDEQAINGANKQTFESKKEATKFTGKTSNIQSTSLNKSSVYTAENPMPMLFRKGNMYINNSEANATTVEK